MMQIGSWRRQHARSERSGLYPRSPGGACREWPTHRAPTGNRRRWLCSGDLLLCACAGRNLRGDRDRAAITRAAHEHSSTKYQPRGHACTRGQSRHRPSRKHPAVPGSADHLSADALAVAHVACCTPRHEHPAYAGRVFVRVALV